MRRRPTKEDWQRVHDIGDDPPPSMSTKWASWLSAITLAAFLGASSFAFAPWIQRLSSDDDPDSDSDSDSGRSGRHALENETTGRFLARGAAGAGVGAVVGSLLLANSQRKKNKLDP